MISLPEELHRRVRSYAEEAYPFECCGFLLGTPGDDLRRVLEIAPALNRRADSPRNRYLISPEGYRETERDAEGRGMAILGFFHSHPDATALPSEYDREHAWPWFSYLIVSVLRGRADETTCWRLSDDRAELRREAVLGTGDRVSGPA